MSTMTLERPMAKKMGRPVTGQDNGTAKIDRGILRKVDHVAKYKGMTIAEYLSAVVGPVVDRDMQAIAAEMLKPSAKK